MNPSSENSGATNERWVLLAAILASAMAFIDATALNVALPAIQTQLSATGTELLWIVNAYTVVTAALILFGGSLGDSFGRKRIFSIGIGLFVVASLACGLAPSTSGLITARVFQGLGAALMIPGSLAMISSVFEPSRRGRAIGIWSACSVVMTALGPIVGGLLADIGWWRAIFFINLPIGLVSLFVLRTKVSTVGGAGNSESLDYVGAALSIAGLAGLNFGLIEAASRGWSDPLVVAVLVGSGCCGVAFVANESRVARPMLPMNLFRNRKLVAACQLTLLFYSGLYGMLFFLALNLIQVQDYRASVAGLAQLPVILLVILLSPIAGQLVDRYGPRIPLTCAGILAASGFALLAQPGLTSDPSDYWVSFFPPLVLLGMAMGISAAPLSTTIMNGVPESQSGIASGINSTLSRLSSVLGLAVLGPIAIGIFARSLMRQAESLDLSGPAIIALQRETPKFADASPPPGISPASTDAIEQAIRVASVDAFRVVSWSSAILVGLSTLLTFALLTPRSETASAVALPLATRERGEKI